MIFNIHAGHNADGYAASGAVGILKESVEDRKVKDEVIRLLKKEGHTVYDCTVDNAGSQSANLKQIVAKCNSHKVDLDVSIHFNCYNGKAHGVEVLGYNNATKSIADRVCNKISALGFNNRGYKLNQELYVLKNTKAPAILIECCFIDNQSDINHYDYKSMARAIVEGLLGKSINASANDVNTTSNKLYAVCVKACKYDSAKRVQAELIAKGYKDTYLIPR